MIRSAFILALLAGPLTAQTSLNVNEIEALSYEEAISHLSTILTSSEPTEILHYADVRHDVWSDSECMLSIVEDRYVGADTGQNADIQRTTGVIDLRDQRVNWIVEDYSTAFGHGVMVTASDEAFERTRTLFLDPPRNDPSLIGAYDQCSADGQTCTRNLITAGIGLSVPNQTYGHALGVRYMLQRLVRLCDDMPDQPAAVTETPSK